MNAHCVVNSNFIVLEENDCEQSLQDWSVKNWWLHVTCTLSNTILWCYILNIAGEIDNQGMAVTVTNRIYFIWQQEQLKFSHDYITLCEFGNVFLCKVFMQVYL